MPVLDLMNILILSPLPILRCARTLPLQACPRPGGAVDAGSLPGKVVLGGGDTRWRCFGAWYAGPPGSSQPGTKLLVS